MSRIKQLLNSDVEDDKYLDDEYRAKEYEAKCKAEREFKLSPHERVFSEFIESLFTNPNKPKRK
ncbi:MAG TPA: hypothetical protein EYO58_06020 [Flavobacteriales bacterium]|nr:hypothetical protein [Flavobacteriales bacterium]